jgi:hypothetical protein
MKTKGLKAISSYFLSTLPKLQFYPKKIQFSPMKIISTQI